MALTTAIKNTLNKVLHPLNLRLETLTSERHEADRIAKLHERGHFASQFLPLANAIASFDPALLAGACKAYEAGISRLMAGGAHPGLYSPENPFFRSPDAEVLYAMVRQARPRRILEVGSGNSTRIIRQAIADGELVVAHRAVDPAPRLDIVGFVDEIIRAPLEHASLDSALDEFEEGDILFIDSSHEVKLGNDVATLFCNYLPRLPSGILVHVHDIFLPFDYPEDFVEQEPGISSWGEQYMLQMLLSLGSVSVIWPGYYVQKLRPDLYDVFPFVKSGRAQSFWFRT